MFPLAPHAFFFQRQAGFEMVGWLANPIVRGFVMARARKANKKQQAESYDHPEADSPMRPDVGTQAQFKKKKPPKTYRYDSSLSPELNWDGQNSAREQGEALIGQILEAESLEQAKEAATQPKPMSKPFPNGVGKAE